MRYPGRMRFWLGLALVAASCTRSNENVYCSEGSCADPAFPYCDTEGAISGEPGTCIAVTCTPGELQACVGDDALTCNARGDGYDRVPCELGCKASPSVHCAYIEPRYLPDICDSPALTGSLSVVSSGMLDPNLDATCNGGVVDQTGAPSICVAHYGDISVASDVTLKILGSKTATGRSIALVADNALRIDGVLDISADKDINGPGGGGISSGGAPMVMSSTTHVGGGGAGGKTAGGAGGSNAADGGANNGGLALADPAVLAVFMGGASAAKLSDGSRGGGGGGGALLISCHGTVSIAGTVDAGGGGGGAGVYVPVTPTAGIGATAFAGGAGGYVVVQAVHVEITGGMFANGGGGGGGMQASQLPGVDGEDGYQSSMFGARGGTSQNGEGRGGNGGARLVLPGVGGKPTTSPATAGGGGGSTGFLQVYTPPDIAPMITPTDASPAFQPSGTIKTR